MKERVGPMKVDFMFLIHNFKKLGAGFRFSFFIILKPHEQANQKQTGRE